MALVSLIQSGLFDSRHLKVLCDESIFGSRLHVLFKTLGKKDVHQTLEAIEQIRSSGTVPSELTDIPCEIPTSNNEKTIILEAFEELDRAKWRNGNMIMSALIGRLPPPVV